MSEREKTIAEIQFVVDNYPENDLKPSFSDQETKAFEMLCKNKIEWLRFLLTELSDAQEQNRKLIEERDDLSFREREAYGAFKYWFGAWQEVKKENGQLKDQLQSAQAEAEKWKRKHEECAKISMMLADRNVEQGDEIEQLRRELAEKDEFLRWYADTMNYEYKTSYLDQDAPILDDCGQRARDVLEKWK